MLKSFLINTLNKLLFIFDYILDTLLLYFKLLCVTLFNYAKDRIKLAFAKKVTILKAPSIDILKPEVSSLFSIFNRISGILLLFLLYFFLKISIYFDFDVYISFLCIYCIFFLFFFHLVYGRLKLTLFYDKLYFLVGNNFLIINIIFFLLIIFILIIILFLVYFLVFMYITIDVLPKMQEAFVFEHLYDIFKIETLSFDKKIARTNSFYIRHAFVTYYDSNLIQSAYAYFTWVPLSIYIEILFARFNIVCFVIIIKAILIGFLYGFYYICHCIKYYISNKIYITDFNKFFTIFVYDYYDPYYIDIDIILPLYYHFYLKWLDRFKTVANFLRSLYNILTIVYLKK